MEFSEFIKKLEPALRRSTETNPDYTARILMKLFTDENFNIHGEYSDSSLKGFYNGNISLNGFAKKFSSEINPQVFESYINAQNEDTKERLCRSFIQEYPEIKKENVEVILSELFISIIDEAAQSANTRKRRSAQQNNDQPDSQLADSNQTPLSPDNIFLEKIPESNIHLDYRREVDNFAETEERFKGIDELFYANYACSTFFSGYLFARQYEQEASEIKKTWHGKTIKAVLTNPLSEACIDAAAYKMYPQGMNTNYDKLDIIPKMISNQVEFRNEFIKDYDGTMELHITDIALPYGLMFGSFYGSIERDWLKVDLYSPVIPNDGKRESCYLFPSIDEQRNLYDGFKSTFLKIFDHYSYEVDEYKDSLMQWLMEDHKRIAHRGVCHSGVKEHTLDAYIECMKKGLPIEVDLLPLRDGNVIVFRDDAENISSMTIGQFKRNRRKNEALKGALTFDELLDLIRGRCPLLIELKGFSYIDEEPDRTTFVKNVMRTLIPYSARYKGDYALHTANPYILKDCKKYNYLVPCGLISWSFERDDIADDVKEVHRSASWTEIATPDFISFKIDELDKEKTSDETYGDFITSIASDLGIRVIGWTAKSEEDIKKAEEYHLVSVIAEANEHDLPSIT